MDVVEKCIFLFAFVVRVQRKSFLQLAIRQAEANIY